MGLGEEHELEWGYRYRGQWCWPANHLVSPSRIDLGLKLPLVLKMTLALFFILFLDSDGHP